MTDDTILSEDTASASVVEPSEEFASEIAFVLPPDVLPSEVVAPEPEVADTVAPIVASPRIDVASLSEAISAMEAGLGRRLDAIASAFDREIRAEALREKVVDRLHAELQEYKQDLLLNVMRPVFIDLIQLHDDIGKIIDANSSSETTADSRGVMIEHMRGLQQGIEDVLYRQGVEPYHLDGDGFDPRRQRALATIATDEESRNKLVAKRLRKGFRTGEKVIRPEMVAVYSYRKRAENA